MLWRTMHHVHGASPPNKNNLVIGVNDFMTPQPKSIIQNVVHFGQKSGKFGQDFIEK